MRILLNRLKKPLYKDDLIYVLLHGFLTAVFVGAVLGSIDYFIQMNTNGISFSIFILAIGYFVGIRIRSHYYNYHLLYSILAIVFTIIGYYVFNIAIAVQIFKNLSIIKLAFDSKVLMLSFEFLAPWNGYFFSFSNVWRILIFLVMLYLAYHYSKNQFLD